jgi:hypothetical protein
LHGFRHGSYANALWARRTPTPGVEEPSNAHTAVEVKKLFER